MNSYSVIYEHRVEEIYSFWTYATETIEARGIVHAQTLAYKHLRELKKKNKHPRRIGKISQVPEFDN